MGIKIILCTNLNEREKRGESKEKPRFSAKQQWRRSDLSCG